MRFIATNEALIKLNLYGLSEKEVIQEFEGRLKCEEEDGTMGDLIINWKNEDLVILPLGKKTAIIFEYGQELKGSYEDLPQIVYRDNKWQLKET